MSHSTAKAIIFVVKDYTNLANLYFCVMMQSYYVVCNLVDADFDADFYISANQYRYIFRYFFQIDTTIWGQKS